MNLLQIFGLALVRGFAELLPVSSSVHVIRAEKLMGWEPTASDVTRISRRAAPSRSHTSPLASAATPTRCL